MAASRVSPPGSSSPPFDRKDPKGLPQEISAGTNDVMVIWQLTSGGAYKFVIVALGSSVSSITVPYGTGSSTTLQGDGLYYSYLYSSGAPNPGSVTVPGDTLNAMVFPSGGAIPTQLSNAVDWAMNASNMGLVREASNVVGQEDLGSPGRNVPYFTLSDGTELSLVGEPVGSGPVSFQLVLFKGTSTWGSDLTEASFGISTSPGGPPPVMSPVTAANIHKSGNIGKNRVLP